MAESIPQDMTLQQAFEIHTKGKSDKLIDNFRKTLVELEKAGYPPDTPVSQVNTEEAITKIQKYLTTVRFKKITVFVRHARLTN